MPLLRAALVLALLMLPVSSVQSQEDALQSSAQPIRSIEPTDDDFSDLLPLIDLIGEARVVVLGEATHSEGTTSQAKARMVHFLHQRMGFDVLAWESGLVQAYGMNAALRDRDRPLLDGASYLMSGGWATEEAIQSVFGYARASWLTDRPLEMAGFDRGRPRAGAAFWKIYFLNLFARTPSLAFTDEEWVLAERLTARGYGFLSSEAPDPEMRTQERAVLERLLARLRAHRPTLRRTISEREFAVAERFILDALQSERSKLLQGAEANYARDRAMANTFSWLFETLYPDRKIIVWAATGHFIRHSNRIENLDHPDWYTKGWEAGNHLYPLLGDDLYTIAFTSYSGTGGDVFPEGSSNTTQTVEFEPAPPGSAEAQLHALGEPYLYLDLAQLPRTHSWRQPFISIALGRLVNRAPWTEIVDAFFFIDHAEPIQYVR